MKENINVMNNNMDAMATGTANVPVLPARPVSAPSGTSTGFRRHVITGHGMYDRGATTNTTASVNGEAASVATGKAPNARLARLAKAVPGNTAKTMADVSGAPIDRAADLHLKTAPSGFWGKIRSGRLGLTTFDIKMIGVVLMVVDHIHQMFASHGAPNWLDWFGRPVATLFFFVSVIGFSHTHSKKAYMVRLYVCMVLMAVLDVVLQQVVNYDGAQLVNNIFRDLFIGTVFMAAVDCFEAAFKKRGNKASAGFGAAVRGGDERTGSAHGVIDRNDAASAGANRSDASQSAMHAGRHTGSVTRGFRVKKTMEGVLLLALPFLLSLVLLPFLAQGDGPQSPVMIWVLRVLTVVDPAILLAENTVMVLLIPVMYALRNAKYSVIWQSLAIAVVAVCYAFAGQTQWIMIFAVIPILLYNGVKGRGDKYFFYIFYPAHIAALYVLASLV
ncbi:TraX family protein [Bifidobacterium sp. ESL0784]|uniref:TraX family protein n=1 Tax=Bifidobacterium sp. ESL0784 TaxID=2983231 RepID=UPI0023F84C04|nr:TraX family protein [Bifidobacterium sp. ESL0784]MDF7641082.1 TraX family protein [Bifidobacterium sp. ESL0784]